MTANDTTPNDSTTTVAPRYSVWPSEELAMEQGPDYATWQEAHENQAVGNDKWRVWEHTVTDVTESNPEGTHPMTPEPAQPTIPAAVKELTIRRDRYKEGVLYLTIKGDEWGWQVITTDDDVLNRIHIIANAAEAMK